MDTLKAFSPIHLPLFAALFLNACSHAATSDPSADDFSMFYEHDYETLLSLRTENSGRGQLAAAVVHSMLFNDEKAETELKTLIETSDDPSITARARRSLSGVYVRQGRYGDAANVMTEIINMPDADGVTIDPQSAGFFAALSSVPPITTDGIFTGSVSVVRDKVDLLHIDISVGGTVDQAIFDTGAAVSAITVTMANKMGLRQLGGAVDVGGSTGATVTSGLATADELRIGGAVFYNVPFVVVPDASMSFPEQDYHVSSVLGLPVISRMGRLTLSSDGKEETLSFAPSSYSAESRSANLITSGWELVALATVNDAPRRQRFFLDTGAKTSSLYALITDVLPNLLDNAESGSRSTGGLGGQIVKQETTILPEARFRIGSVLAEIGPINVVENDGSFRHGVLGQDILMKFDRVTIDFGAMVLEVE